MKKLLLIILLATPAYAQESQLITQCKDTIAALDIIHVRVEDAQTAAAVKQSVIKICQDAVKLEQEKAKPEPKSEKKKKD